MYQMTYEPQYRDADRDTLVGVYGYLAMLQDIILAHAELAGIGTIDLKDRTGIGWMFTRYRLCVHAKARIGEPVELTTWVSSGEGQRFLNHEFQVSRAGALLAEGRVENCFFDVRNQKLSSPQAISFPVELYEPERGCAAVGGWRALSQDPSSGRCARTYTIGSSDIDSDDHMNNLRYACQVLDAFSGKELADKAPIDVELHFQRQCFEGDTLRIMRADGIDDTHLALLADTDLPASVGLGAMPQGRVASSISVVRDGEVACAAMVTRA